MKVVIYSANPCPWCVRAKDLFKKAGIPFEEVDITDNDAEWERLSRENNGWRTVPMIFIDGKFIGGFDEVQKLKQQGGLAAR